MTNYPCGTCVKEDLETDKGIGYDHWKKWVHHKYHELSDFDFKYLQNNKDCWYCIKCIPQNFPFCTNEINQANISSKYLSKAKPALLNLIKQLDNYSNEQNNENNQGMLDCKYRNIEYFKKLSNPFKTKSLSLLHLNICYLQKKIDNFHILLNELNINLDIIAITESRIRENVSCPINIQLPNYSIEHNPTEASTGGTFLYINNRSS